MPDKYFHKMGTLQVIIMSSIITKSNEHLDRFGETKTDQRLSLCSLQWDYNRELARLGNLEPLPDATENLYMAVRTEDEKCPLSLLTRKPLEMFTGSSKKASRSGDLQKGYVGDGKS